MALEVGVLFRDRPWYPRHIGFSLYFAKKIAEPRNEKIITNADIVDFFKRNKHKDSKSVVKLYHETFLFLIILQTSIAIHTSCQFITK